MPTDKERAKEWRKEHRAEINQRRREWYEHNKQRLIAEQVQWQQEHRVQINARKREDYAEIVSLCSSCGLPLCHHGICINAQCRRYERCKCEQIYA